MLGLESIEPIRMAIGSKTRRILDGLIAKLDKSKPDFAEYAKAMIMESAPAKEPGCWNYLVQPLAKSLGLKVRVLPLNDWKHYAVWEEYRQQVNSKLSRASKQLLKLLEKGRALRGKAIIHDGCMFAWLSTDEVALLLAELLPLEIAEPDYLEPFHAELIKSFQLVVDNKMELFLGAH